MTTAAHPERDEAPGTDRWYDLATDDVTARLGVDPSVGLPPRFASCAQERRVEQVRLLGTTPLRAGQFGLALASGVLLLVLWELGKLLARRCEAPAA